MGLAQGHTASHHAHSANASKWETSSRAPESPPSPVKKGTLVLFFSKLVL